MLPAFFTALAGARVVVFIAHPDDELFCAGLMALCAARGAEVHVICATGGEKGSRRERGYRPDIPLGDLRWQELEASCAALGAQPPTPLGWPDGGLSSLDPERMARALAEHLSGEPELTLSCGPDGVYGHVDHTRLCAVTAGAWAMAGQPGRLFHTAFPQGLAAPLWKKLRRLKGIIDPALGADDMGHAQGAVDLVLPLDSTLRAAKEQAMAAHRSQLAQGRITSFLGPAMARHLLDVEWYRVAGGPPLPTIPTPKA